MSNPCHIPMLQLGQIGDLTYSVCPTVGNLTSGYVKSPLLPHIIPRGGGGGEVGEYIDRCITDSSKTRQIIAFTYRWSFANLLSRSARYSVPSGSGISTIWHIPATHSRLGDSRSGCVGISSGVSTNRGFGILLTKLRILLCFSVQ